jgi:hypothetical protein
MLVEGNEIANGTFDGRDLADADDGAVAEQIDATNEAVRDATGDDPCFVRPPFGSDADRVADIAAERGLTTALWSVDPGDYLAESWWDVASHVLTDVEPGDVVVLHDGGDNRRDITIEALPAIVTGLQARGYRLVTVSELLAWEEATTACPDCDTPARIDDTPMLARHVVPAAEAAPGGVTQSVVRPGSAPAEQGSGSDGGSGGRPSDGGSEGGSGGAGSGGGSSSGGATQPSPEPPLVVDDPQPPPEHPQDGPGGGGGGGSGEDPGGGGDDPGGGDQGGGGSPGTPPGHGGTPPGHGGTPPGQDGSGSGQGSASPGHGGTPPGQGGTPPGQGGTPPGQGKD